MGGREHGEGGGGSEEAMMRGRAGAGVEEWRGLRKGTSEEAT